VASAAALGALSDLCTPTVLKKCEGRPSFGGMPSTIRYDKAITSFACREAPMRIAYPILVVLTSCLGGITVNLVPTNPAPQTMRPKPASEVKIVSTPPESPFVEIGFVDGRTNISSPPEAILATMRSAAGPLGCDALLITGSTIIVHEGTFGYHSACLVFTDAPSPAPPAPANTQENTPGATAATIVSPRVPAPSGSWSSP
jgi:hypothetical protein